MHTVFPAEQVAAHFTKPVIVKQYGMAQYDEIVEEKPAAIGGLGLHCWHRIVQVEKRNVNPRAVAPHIDAIGVGKKSIIPYISSVIGTPLIKDISLTVATIDDPALMAKLGENYMYDEPTVAVLMLAHVHPNNIHIVDVYYQNPYQPLPANKRHEWAWFKGLKLLGPTIDRLEAFAREKGIETLTLTASADDLVPLFASYGFSLETNHIGKMARAMEKKVA